MGKGPNPEMCAEIERRAMLLSDNDSGQKMSGNTVSWTIQLQQYLRRRSDAI